MPQTFFDSRAILSSNTGTSCRKKCRRKKQWPVDVTGLCIYFGVALLILRGTLL